MTHDSRRYSGRRAFTMVELLTVITLITVITALGVQGLGGGSSAGRMRRALVETTSILSQARMLAVSQNTYVYIFFRPDTQKRRVSVMMVYSTTGLNVYRSATQPLSAVSDSLAPAHPRIVLEDTALLEHSAIPTEGSGSIARPQPGLTMELGSDYQLSHQGEIYSRSLVFRPTGEVYIPPQAYTGIVEFALQPDSSSASGMPGPLAAVVQVVGATGQTRVYRADK